MRKKLIVLLACMVAAGITGTLLIAFINRNKGNDTGDGDSKLMIVTSFYPTYIIGLNIAEGIPGLLVDSLTDFSAGCLHDYQLTTGDMKLLSNADVFLMNGGGMESYMEDVVRNYPDLTILEISEGIDMLPSGEHEGEDNPHVWLDPQRYLLQIRNARDGLVHFINQQTELDSEYREDTVSKINENTEQYLEKINILEEELEALALELKGRDNKVNSDNVIIFHEAFAYLAKRVGLTVAHTVEMEGDTAFSASEIAAVIELVKKEDIGSLFTEEQYGDTITDRIAGETGAIAYQIDSAVTGEGTKDSYLKAMEKNLNTLKEAFR